MIVTLTMAYVTTLNALSHQQCSDVRIWDSPDLKPWKIRFAVKSLLSTTQTVEEAVTYATTEPSEWWISVKTEAESLGINLEPLIQLREDWLRNRHDHHRQSVSLNNKTITIWMKKKSEG